MTVRAARLTVVVLACLGVAIAAYLTTVHYAHASPVCIGGSGSCQRVQTSEYAEAFSIPVAVIGLGGYLTILILTLLPFAWRHIVVLTLAAGAFAFSAYLTAIELWVIDAICQWCVASAVNAMALLVAAFAWAAAESRATQLRDDDDV